MHKNKLLHLIASLPKSELRKFGHHLRLLHSNKGQNAVELFDFLYEKIDRYPLGKELKLKQDAFQCIFPKSTYNDVKLRGLLSVLFRHLENFMVLEESHLQPQKREELLRQHFKRHHLEKFIFHSLEKSILAELKGKTRDRHFHFQQMALGHERYFHSDEQRYAKKAPMQELLELHFHLDCHYCISKLDYGCAILAAQRIRGTVGKVDFLKEVIAYAKCEKFEKEMTIQVYWRMAVLLETPNEEGFYSLKKRFFETLAVFSPDTLPSLLILLINACWFSCPPSQRTHEIFELYMKGIETGILLSNGLITAPNFNNIVNAGCAIGEFDRIRQFLKDYMPSLQTKKDARGNIERLYEAMLLFGEGKFPEVLHQLNFLEFEDFSYGLRAYSLQLRSIYEKDKNKSYKQIDHYSRAFKQYLQRKYKQHFISKEIQQEYHNFLKIMINLPFAEDSNYSRVTKKRLMKQLLGMERVHNRAWLLEKIELI